MRKIVCLLLVFAAVQVQAKSIREVWTAMPDSMIPYLTKTLRLEMLDFTDMGVRADVKNVFGGVSEMDTLTADYLKVTLNVSSELQMKMLPVQGSDSVVCVVRTYMGPVAESIVSVYSQDWTLIRTLDFTAAMETDEESLLSACLSAEDNTLFLKKEKILASKEDKEAGKDVVKQTTVKWDGETFK